MKTQFITDSKGNKIAVILPVKSYQQMLEKIEDLDDVRLFDAARAEGGKPMALKDYLKSRTKKK
jgi:hypothetical protein